MRYTTETFIAKASAVHNNKYNYNYSEYKGCYIKVIIICKKHGKFLQTPGNHLFGQGCPQCFGKIKKTFQEFAKKSNEVHNNLYTYISYTKMHDYMIAICSVHGEFKQIAYYHIQGSKCPQCASNLKSDIIKFKLEAFAVHGNRYNYDKSEYISSKYKLIITCKIHGDFLQKPNSHIADKNGCPKCKLSHGENRIFNYLENNNIKYLSQHKYLDCKNINLLPFDFYLPQYNLLIEYDGEQHFIEVNMFKRTLEEQKNIDKIKNEYCIKNSIPLLRIKYTDYENIECILKEKINEYKVEN